MCIHPRQPRCAVFLLFLFLAAFAGKFADCAIVRGTVTDPLGSPVSGAQASSLSLTETLFQAPPISSMASNSRLFTDDGRFYVAVAGKSFHQMSTSGFYAGRFETVERNIILEPESVTRKSWSLPPELRCRRNR